MTIFYKGSAMRDIKIIDAIFTKPCPVLNKYDQSITRELLDYKILQENSFLRCLRKFRMIEWILME